MGCEGCFRNARQANELLHNERIKAKAYAVNQGKTVVIFRQPDSGQYGFVEADKFPILRPGELIEFVTGLATA